MAHIMRNTDKDYPCTQCGSAGNIVREGPDPRLKCSSCNFMYDASVSLEAQKAGAIPDGLPEEIREATAVDNPRRANEASDQTRDARGSSGVAAKGVHSAVSVKVPRSPSYCILSKDRKSFEFTTKKDFKQKLLRWIADDRKYDVFELHPKSVAAKIDID